jgi:DNA-binding Lrp family transcriptional regulator
MHCGTEEAVWEGLMAKLLTALDTKILRAMCEVGPRNLAKIARTVEIPRDTLRFRIKRMQSNPQIFLRAHTSIYHTNIGLKKAVVFAEAKPGKEQVLFDCLKANGFWLYVSRSYGMGEGCTAIYAVPVEHCREFEEFAHELQHLEVAENVQVYWSTCFEGGRLTSEWLDNQEQNWIFRWDNWIREVETQTTDLPYTLIEAESYPIRADDIDVRMLVKLEKDATTSLSEIAEMLGISRQLARFHFQKHLIGKNLIEGYEIFAMLYGDAPCVGTLFVVSFHDHDTLARFARSLLNKFFFIAMGKIFGENAVIMEVYLPSAEFRNFIDALSKLAGMRLVKSYKYAIQDLRVRSRQTFSGEFFRNRSWIYDHKSHVEALRGKVFSSLSQVTVDFKYSEAFERP